MLNDEEFSSFDAPSTRSCSGRLRLGRVGAVDPFLAHGAQIVWSDVGVRIVLRQRLRLILLEFALLRARR